MSVLLCRDSRHFYSAVSASEDFLCSILRYINVHITLHYITFYSVNSRGFKPHNPLNPVNPSRFAPAHWQRAYVRRGTGRRWTRRDDSQLKDNLIAWRAISHPSLISLESPPAAAAVATPSASVRHRHQMTDTDANSASIRYLLLNPQFRQIRFACPRKTAQTVNWINNSANSH